MRVSTGHPNQLFTLDLSARTEKVDYVGPAGSVGRPCDGRRSSYFRAARFSSLSRKSPAATKRVG